MAEPKARLLCRTGQLAGVTYELGADSTVGRDADNDAVLLAETVSGRHARIFHREGSYFVEDLGSRNGTLVDGVPVEGTMPLDALNIITVSETCDLIFQVMGPGAAKPMESPMPAVAVEPSPLPASPAPPTPEPAELSPSPPLQATGPPTENRTRVDLEAFGPLPDLEAVTPTVDIPQPSPGARLEVVVHIPGRAPRTVDLEPGETVMGRSGECDIVVDHDSLSRKHAALVVSSEGIVLKDLGSTNGTFVDEREVSEMVISPNTRFALGSDVEVEVVTK